MNMVVIPQVWIEHYSPLPGAYPYAWWQTHGQGIQLYWPECVEMIDQVAQEVDIDPRLLITRIELEQSAISYAWDGSTTHYGGGPRGDELKLRYLCGVDRTDGGDRPNGWFGPGRQLSGCALRFKYWYRGMDGLRRNHISNTATTTAPPEWRNWLGLGPTSMDIELDGTKPANLASAMCFRYTPHLQANTRLSYIGRKWFPEDYAAEEHAPIEPEPAPEPNSHINWATQYGISDGTRLDEPATRAETITMISRTHELLCDQLADQVALEVDNYLTTILTSLPWWKRLLFAKHLTLP